ncbi:hypothetical protein [Nonomuraea terrae]|nr:hypothetical protein [Nonomuraea terrae]
MAVVTGSSALGRPPRKLWPGSAKKPMLATRMPARANPRTTSIS